MNFHGSIDLGVNYGNEGWSLGDCIVGAGDWEGGFRDTNQKKYVLLSRIGI